MFNEKQIINNQFSGEIQRSLINYQINKESNQVVNKQ